MGDRSVPVRRTYDQPCPVAHALDVVGERWTLLIVRDLLFGPLRFTDLRDGLPGLAPNLLSERLRWLTERGLVEQVELAPPAARRVYALTSRGRELGPVVHGLARFGVADWEDPDREPPPERLLRGALLALMSPERLGPTRWSALLRLGDDEVGLEVRPPDPAGSPLARLRLTQPPPEGPVDLVVRASLGTLLAMHRGELDLGDALERQLVDLDGPDRVVAQLTRLLGIPAPGD